MNLWRRFVRWLARDEIARVSFELMSDHASRSFALCRARAEGEAAGHKAAMDEIERVIGERTSGMGDYVMPEDIVRAKRGRLH